MAENLKINEIQESFAKVNQALSHGAKISRKIVNVYLKGLIPHLSTPQRERIPPGAIGMAQVMTETISTAPILVIPGVDEWLSSEHIAHLSDKLEKLAAVGTPFRRQVFFDMVDNILTTVVPRATTPKPNPNGPAFQMTSGQAPHQTKEVLTEAEAADFLCFEKKKLALLRKNGTGPEFSRPTPRGIRYSRTDLLEFLEKSKNRSM